MDVSRSGRVRKKSSLLVDYDTAENVQLPAEDNLTKAAETSTEELLESLDGLVESNFSDSLASTIVNAGESLYLSIWKQPNKEYKKGERMKFLPLFYVICSIEKGGNVLLKLIAYNGKVIQEIKSRNLKDETKINFIGKLRTMNLCLGIPMPEKSSLDLKIYTDHDVLVEQLEDDDIVMRSQKCILGMNETGSVCKNCQTIGNYLDNKTSELDIEVETTLDNETLGEDEEPMESESLEVSGFDVTDEGNECKNDTSVDGNNTVSDTKTSVELQKKSVKPVFKCKHCEFETTKKEGMANHIIDNHLKTNSLLCEYCDFKCSKKMEMAQHCQEVHDIEYKESAIQDISMFRCDQCSYETSKKTLLNKHMENVHEKTPKKPFIKCQQCDFKTRRPDRMTQHVGKVHENNDRPFQCEQCLFKFTAQKSLDKHISAVHHQIKPYMCNFCPYKSAYQKQLTWHINTVHHNIRPYVCETCGYKAAQKRNLARHIQTAHEKRYPFKCGLCSYEAARKEQVTKHIRATHEGIKPLQCSFCEYRYVKNYVERI